MTLNSFNPLAHVKLTDVTKSTDCDSHSVTAVHLPVTKVFCEGEDVAWGLQQQPDIDPDTLLAKHFLINLDTLLADP